MILYALAAITGIVTSVHDGDTFRIGLTAIRLAGIDANELHGGCHATCAPMSAIDARDSLRGLILGRQVTCEPTGRSYRRIVAWCQIGGHDLSCEMVRSGAAVRWARYDPDNRLHPCGAMERGRG